MNKESQLIGKYLPQIMSVLDPEGKCPMPEVKIVRSSKSNWAGICHTRIIGLNANGITANISSEVLIQKYAAENEELFKILLAHECCHHVNCYLTSEYLPAQFLQIELASLGHGKSFQDLCNKLDIPSEPGMNAEMAQDGLLDGYEMYVLLWKNRNANGRIEFGVTNRPSKKQLAVLMYCIVKDYQLHKLIKSKKIMFSSQKGVFGKNWNFPKDIKLKEYLEFLWDTELDILEKFLRSKVNPKFFENIEVLRQQYNSNS